MPRKKHSTGRKPPAHRRILPDMQAAEIELKFRVHSQSTLERRLSELGYHLDTARTLERNTLYDTPDRALRTRGELLRVREYGGRATVTHKRHPEHEDPASRYKVRIETESEVTDGAALAEIFCRLGYGPAFRYEKYRSEYSHRSEDGAHVVLDETPIGTFAELEGPTAWIDRALADLGVSASDCLTESYGKLFLAWRADTGSLAENLTFDEIASPMLAGV